MLKLFAFQPKGHGEYSFFVMAKKESEAIEAVEKWAESEYGSYWRDEYFFGGWGTDYYTVKVFDRGQVVINDND